MCNDGERVGVGKGCQVYYQLSIQIQCILSILSNNIPAKIGVRDSNLNECTHVQGKKSASIYIYIYIFQTKRNTQIGGQTIRFMICRKQYQSSVPNKNNEF